MASKPIFIRWITNHKINRCFVSHGLRPLEANKASFDLYNLLSEYPRKVSIIRSDPIIKIKVENL